MDIRATTPADVPAVMGIIEEARRTIASLGIDQWQNGSPNEAMITADVEAGQSRIVVQDGAVVGTFAVIDNGEPVYTVIENGGWQTPDKDAAGAWTYIALHRVAISLSHRGSGISTAVIEYAEETARAMGRKSLRIDTHEGNVVMRRMLEKHGFTPCGIIHLENGDPRVAYEKIVA